MEKHKALYVPCYSGELGWEVINYVPYVNRMCIKNVFKEVHVVLRTGREALYPMGTHFYPIELSTHKSMGNSGVDPPKDKVCKKLKKRNFEIAKVKPLGNGCRLTKKREFIKYKADKDHLKKWDVPKNSAVLCVRDRSFGRHKNWNGKKWESLCSSLLEKSFSPIVTGIRGKIKFNLPDGCMDLRDMTSIADFIALVQKAKFVVGQSTGPAHLASLCGVPHAIWGSSRIQERYLKSWNPHRTPVEYLSLGKHFDAEVDEVVNLVDKLLKKI